MGETIDLRAHHVGVVLDELEYSLAIKDLENFPNSRDLQIYLADCAKRLHSNRKGYGDEVWDFISSLAMRARSEADLRFRIVDSQDAICHSDCPFQEDCARGEYANIYKVLDMAGVNPLRYHNCTVEDNDREVARERGYELGKIYSASDLFPPNVLQP